MFNLIKRVACFQGFDRIFIFIISNLLIFPLIKKRKISKNNNLIRDNILDLKPSLRIKEKEFLSSYDPVSKKNFPNIHYKKINYSTKSIEISENLGDFIIPAFNHKHGWLLSELIISVNEKKDSAEKLNKNLKIWRKKFPIGYGVPYIITEHSTNFARGNFSQRQLHIRCEFYAHTELNMINVGHTVQTERKPE